MHKLTLRHSGEVLELDGETSVLEALREQNIYVKSSCGGNGSCSDCIVKVTAGEDNVTEPTFDEMQLLGNVFHITKERLSCQTKLTGDVTIDVSTHDKAADESKLKAKTSSFKKAKSNSTTRVRKKEEVDEIIQERKDKASAKRELQDTEWQKHWEKDKEDGARPKRLGGGKRPKLFRTDNINYDDKSSKYPAKDKKSDSKNFKDSSKKSYDKDDTFNKLNDNTYDKRKEGGFPKAPVESVKREKSEGRDFRKQRKK